MTTPPPPGRSAREEPSAWARDEARKLRLAYFHDGEWDGTVIIGMERALDAAREEGRLAALRAASPPDEPGRSAREDDTRLLPCPFCGSPAAYGDSDDGGRFIECGGALCHASTNLMHPLKDSVDDLLREKWNRRAALRAAAPAPSVQEPVAWGVLGTDGSIKWGAKHIGALTLLMGERPVPLYAAPAQESEALTLLREAREWKHFVEPTNAYPNDLLSRVDALLARASAPRATRAGVGRE